MDQDPNVNNDVIRFAVKLFFNDSDSDDESQDNTTKILNYAEVVPFSLPVLNN